MRVIAGADGAGEVVVDVNADVGGVDAGGGGDADADAGGASAALVVLRMAEAGAGKWTRPMAERVDYIATHYFRAFHVGGVGIAGAAALVDAGSGKIYDGRLQIDCTLTSGSHADSCHQGRMA
ncbi:hypothetical protein MaudCBS49596_000433 [Microsporum audouinii]